MPPYTYSYYVQLFSTRETDLLNIEMIKRNEMKIFCNSSIHIENRIFYFIPFIHIFSGNLNYITCKGKKEKRKKILYFHRAVRTIYFILFHFYRSHIHTGEIGVDSSV